MTDTASPRLSELRQHEEELVFERFGHQDAWWPGSPMAAQAITQGHCCNRYPAA